MVAGGSGPGVGNEHWTGNLGELESDPSCVALSGPLLCIGPHHLELGYQEASESSVPPKQRGAGFACPWQDRRVQDRRVEGSLPRSATGNLGAQPSPTAEGYTISLYATPVFIPVPYSVHPPVLVSPFSFPAVSFLTLFLTPLSPTHPPCSLQGSQNRSPPPSSSSCSLPHPCSEPEAFQGTLLIIKC